MLYSIIPAVVDIEAIFALDSLPASYEDDFSIKMKGTKYNKNRW